MSCTLPLSTHARLSVTPTVRANRTLSLVEERLAAAALTLMFVLPLAEIVVRGLFTSGIPGAASVVQHLTLWVAFLGAALIARDQRLLALATATALPRSVRRYAAVFSAAVAVAIVTILALGAVTLIETQRELATRIALTTPVWLLQVVLPVALIAIAARLVIHASSDWRERAVAGAGAIAGVVLVWRPEVLAGSGLWIALAVVCAAGLAGAPIFVVLGGTAVLLFLADGAGAVAVPIETYSLTVSPTLPAIPLFTLAGFVLAESRASQRLLRLFQGWSGWLPGGTTVVCALICSFFTVFTGGSGVTILALGGLLFPALLREGYRERFSLGLLTASGSLGLLLPPALPLILYAVIAQIPVEDLFRAGILPGLLLTAMVAAWGVREGLVSRRPRVRFDIREALAALWEAKWEAAMPVAILAAIFTGWATPIEAAAVAACYALMTQAVIHRELTISDLHRVFVSCAAVTGGVLIILGVAVGLTSYLVTHDVPALLSGWLQERIASRAMFLLALNGFLLVVGCLMDIFSAIVIVVPLIVPLGLAYGVDPMHLGIIFIANLELGYLTPPVGLNLFLASYRFDRPLVEVFLAVVPFLIILAIGVLLITYVPALTMAFRP